MSAILVLLIVARGDGSDPATVGAVDATHELLGSHVAVLVREFETMPSDERALGLGATLHATATIELSWDPAQHRQAKLRFYFESDPGWNERTIGFTSSDHPAERGRTLGLAMASMLPSAPPDAREIAPWVHPPAAEQQEPPHGTADRAARSLDLDADGAVGLGGNAQGWGGSASLRWNAAHSLGVRVGASFRIGDLPVAQATSRFVHAAVGMVWVPLPVTASRRFELDGRVDALALWEQVSHFSADDPEPVDRSRWMPGADAAIEGAWFFSGSAGLTASMGAEVAFGQTKVTVRDVTVTTLPPLRVVWQLGIRTTF